MGKRFFGLACFLFVLTACPDAALAATRYLTPLPNASAPATLKLAIAGGDNWATDLGLSSLPGATDPAGVALSPCQQGTLSIVPHGSRYIEDSTRTIFCGGQDQYYLIDVPAGTHGFTMLSFTAGQSHTSFKMPALGAVVPGAPQTFDEALTNTTTNTVYVLCGFPGSEGALNVDVYGQDGELLTKAGPEFINCNAPITLYPLKTKFQSGYVVVSNASFGAPGFGATIYGAVVNSTAGNGNARIYPFGDSAP
ncbi:MAG TPA: hypothetical protein VLC46_20325 [Thermoanaerobaculia bacterium]|jgi:hypothetical protein|nr:hypothetical protein [Thermoanaerobaculia bacterium]